MMKAALAITFATNLATVAAAACPADTCFKSVKVGPILNKAASIFCLAYVKPTPKLTTTKTSTVTQTNTIIPRGPTVTATLTTYTTITSGTVCTTSITSAPFRTTTNFVAQPSAIRKREEDHDAEEEELARRQLLVVPQNLKAGCSHSGRALTSKISSACSCFLTPTATRTTTSTVTTSTTLATPNAVTVTTIITSTSTVRPCTSTVTEGSAASKTCGVPISTYTSGSVTCPSLVPTPSANILFRIEGSESEGTIFEGCVVAGPRLITTPSGGSHQCDGTNGNANPAPGTTPTNLIDAAGRMVGFDFDGTWSNQFSDFFITRISTSAQTGTQFWGVLNNEQFTPTGGCQFVVSQGDRTLWAYDAFNKDALLKVSPDFAAVAPGSTVTATIRDGFTGNPISGASISGATSDANGAVSFTAPNEPGCYLFKATRAGSLRSNTFYLSVF